MADSSASINRSLIDACQRANTVEITALLALGADPNASATPRNAAGVDARAWHPLEAALFILRAEDLTPKMAMRAATRAVTLLAEAGADCSHPQTWLEAARRNAEAVLAVLGQRCEALPANLDDVVATAFAHRSYQALATLRGLGADINCRQAPARHPLLGLSCGTLRYAQPAPVTGRKLEGWYTQQMMRLRDCGVDLDVRDAGGATPLMRAIVAGMHHLAKALVRAGADPGARQASGVSALHLSAYCAGEEMVQFLLANGATLADLARLDTSTLPRSLGAFAQASAEHFQPVRQGVA